MYLQYHNYLPFSTLIGKHLTNVIGNVGDGEMVFECSDGTRYGMMHQQDCCEHVAIEDIIGDMADLRDAEVLDAREETSSEHPSDYTPSEYEDSFTWTFYIIQTNKGAVTIRWLGESNGYYGEGVDFGVLTD